MVDMRTSVLDMPCQDLLTKDNIPIRIDSFCEHKISIPELAIFKVKDYKALISVMSAGALKQIISNYTLDD